MTCLRDFAEKKQNNTFVKKSLKAAFEEISEVFQEWEWDNIEGLELDKLLEEIAGVKGEPLKDEELRIIKLKDFRIYDINRQLEFIDIYDISLVSKEENEAYSTFLLPFEKFALTPISEKSIFKYGIYNCVVTILIEIFSLGRTGKERNQNIKAIVKELEETTRRIESEEEKIYPAEEVFEEFKEAKIDHELIEKFKEGILSTEKMNKKIIEEFLEEEKEYEQQRQKSK